MTRLSSRRQNRQASPGAAEPGGTGSGGTGSNGAGSDGAGSDGAGVDGRSDEELMRRLWDADATALSTLYRRFGPSCYSLARRVCGDDGLAEDAVHEVFVALWRDPSHGDVRRGSIATSLLTLVHNKAVDAIRARSIARRSRVAGPATEKPATVPDPDQAASDRVAAGQVRVVLDQLPGEQRAILAAAYFGGHTVPEIAAFTSLPQDTVRSRLATGVRRLRSLLNEQLGPDALIAELRSGWELSR